jgi:hypothetical protein
MDTDFDPDDTIGRRLGALRNWEPPAPDDDAWRRVERRRGRRRSRRYAAATLVVVMAAVATIAVVTSTRSPRRHAILVEPTEPTTSTAPRIVHELARAPMGNIVVSPAGPYHAGQTVRVDIGPSDLFRLEDPYNSRVAVCFPYRGGETCDAGIESLLLPTRGQRLPPGTGAFELELPGWVHTPTGLQPCAKLGCRLEITNDGEHFVGTAPLTIDSGPKPTEPVRINGVPQ